jgi:protein O-GlcNAc transferase
MAKVRKLLNWLTRSAESANGVADRLISEGNRAETAGKLHEACELYRKAVEIAPGSANAHLNLGIGLEAIGDSDGAVKSYDAALAIDSGNPYANYNLGKLLYTRGDLVRAEQLLCAALGRKPEFPEARVVISNIYETQGKLAAAASFLEIALQQSPGYAGAWYNYGNVLSKLGKPAEAETALRRALEIDPSSVPALHLLGNVLRSQSRIREAIDAFALARRLAPDRFDLESMELLTLNFTDEISERALSARHRVFGARLEQAFPPPFASFRNQRDPARRLRIGYVSCDFNLHPVALFAIPLLERHDRSGYEIYCYSTGSKTDDITHEVKARTDVWRDVAKMSDSELADTIHCDQIDILVDLTGHAGVMRLGVFARQPSPVQVTWLGYLSTTGLTRIHYRLCDAVTDPPQVTDQLHTETLVRLPHSQWCYRPLLSIDHAREPPCKSNGFITFGSFNHVPKLSQTLRKLWVDILARLPDSRLVVVGVPEGHAKERLLEDCRAAGVAVSRLTVVPRVPLDEYFRWFSAVDIALDSTPYSGGTTTCDTLWMGVPVITLLGPRSVSRSAAGILSTVGLPDWIASTPEEYVRLAVRFAQDRPVIVNLRQSLRQRMRESPIMDEPRFVRDVENAYRGMWQTWCNGT